MWGNSNMHSVSNGQSMCMDDRKIRTLAPLWRMMLPLPELRWPA
jgi:hypothetical protein